MARAPKPRASTSGRTIDRSGGIGPRSIADGRCTGRHWAAFLTTSGAEIRSGPFPFPGDVLVPEARYNNLSRSAWTSTPQARASAGSKRQCGEKCGLSGRRGDQLPQALRIDWLDQVMVEAGFPGLAAIIVLTVAGDGHEHRLVEAGHGAQVPRHLVAAHPGQADVEQDDLRQEDGGRGQGGRTVAGAADGEAPVLEEGRQGLRGIAVVVHHEDAAGTRLRPWLAPLGGGRIVRRLPVAKVGRGVEEGEPDDHLAAAPGAFAQSPHRAAVQRHELLDEGEADAETALGAVQRALPLDERLEHLW